MKRASLINELTLEEKASLTSGKDFWQTESIKRKNIPSMFLSDGPHGIRRQAEAADHLGLNPSLKATCFPTAAAMANSWNTELGEKMGKALGLEAKSQYVNVLLGPGMNIKRNPLCGRNFEYFSEDPYLAGKMAASYVKGIQSEGVSACLKHFACNNQETRRLVYDSVVDERALREIYLTGFEIAIKEAKPLTIMSSYNRINGSYANENHHLLKGILRDEWKFDGMVVSDWGGNNDRVESLIEGGNLEMPTSRGETNLDIINAVKSGKLDEAILDESVDHYLDVLYKTNDAVNENAKFDIDKHDELARLCAEECMVLLKNNNNILPLKKGSKVAVIGDFFFNPRYQGAGSSIVNPTKLCSFVDLKDEYDFEAVAIERGFDRYGKENQRLIKAALAGAAKADIILYSMGLDEISEAEGLDRKNMRILDNQISLLKSLKSLNKPIVIVLTTGSAVELEFDSLADAVLYTSLYGQAGAKALLNILEGKSNPSGKLCETFANKYSDVPTSIGYPFMGVNIPYKESIYVGYRYFDKNNLDVKYPFGYGLSYSKFEYSNLVVDRKGCKFKIKNISDRDGMEIAQMYIGMRDSLIYRAKKELKGFKKIFIKAHQEVEVEIPFDDYSFRFFNVSSNKFDVEMGKYQIYIASSSKDINLTDEILVDGSICNNIYNQDKIKDYYSGNIYNVDNSEFEEILGHKLEPQELHFIKKNRIIVDYNTTVLDLRYAKGWTGRAFSWGVRFADKVLRAFKKRELANTLVMGVFHNPMRGLSRMSGGVVSWEQLNGLILMFNGHFFKGFNHFLKAGRTKKKHAKELLMLQAENK